MEILGDIRTVVVSPWAEIILVVVSFLCGGIVGSERERSEKPAGLRTLILICMGSTFFTMASMSGVLGVREPARIAAQIVTGVGFLGAGSILRERNGITGLTTAASIWAVSAVGILVGAGYAAAGFASALAIVFTLAGLQRAEEWAGRCARQQIVITYRPERGKTRALLQRIVDQERRAWLVGDERARADGSCERTLDYCTAHREHRAVLALIAQLPAVEGLGG
jgi:putative Mg2+ transporter-C (MgtC) family protein